MSLIDLREAGFVDTAESHESSIPRVKEFELKWSATVKADSAKNAVRRLWASHFHVSDHDDFSVYCGQTKKKYRYRANCLAPELNKSLPGGHVYRVHWKATVFAANEAEALKAAKSQLIKHRPDVSPRVNLGVHDPRGNRLKTEKVGIHDILQLVS
ncbi:hypothetical protein [Halomonas sp. I5-271120]|uniref:hypothetical protein n=1 Tax=Halomonas sp. I5-271120 TaxID=3061632 RepID=UPI002714AADE|nr:hypothetical protein [Halomonas sp. I5-271120]